jgi:hypothetical protein
MIQNKEYGSQKVGVFRINRSLCEDIQKTRYRTLREGYRIQESHGRL